MKKRAMKRASCAFVMSAVMALVSSSCAFKPFKGETIVSPRFKPEGKNIALMCEVSNPDALHLWYWPHLTQALIRNGYQVIGRQEFDKILEELDLDQARYIRKGDREEKAREIESGLFTPSKLKQMSELYGINYLGVYGQWPNKRVYFRIIDCETAEVVATTLFSVPSYRQAYPESMTAYGMAINNTPQNAIINNNGFPHNTADLMVLSLKYASQVKDERGNPRMVFLDISSKKRKEGKSRGVEKILFQKKIRYKQSGAQQSYSDAASLYATICTIYYDLADD